MHIDFWFEFGSTYSYPAAMRVEELAGTYGVGINWRPFLLGVIFQAQGLTDSPFNLHEAKGRYMWRDLERTCEALNIPFRRPSRFPRNGLLAARVACCFDKEPWLSDFVRAVYRANLRLYRRHGRERAGHPRAGAVARVERETAQTNGRSDEDGHLRCSDHGRRRRILLGQ
jgi:2-hydroxychromene-2-carboxylate isomerase